jgi:adenosyl cobinamide kinase/adenosyl cobinamide phosphate guanylyltransferase
MKRLLVGARNSGKSMRAEQILLETATSRIGYVATLPRVSSSQQRIERHQARRGSQWATLEMSDSADASLRMIEDASSQFRHLLLDGVSILVWRTCVLGGGLDEHKAEGFLNSLTSTLDASSADWVLVDSAMPYPELGPNDPFNRLMQTYHRHWGQLT